MSDPLAAFAERHIGSPTPPRTPSPEPPMAFSWVGEIIAFDQALARTGWVHLSISPSGVAPLGVGLIQTESPHKGHEANLRRALTLTLEVTDLVRGVLSELGGRELLVVHEIPPVGRMMRPESSLLAALAIRQVALAEGLPVRMIGAQQAKHRLAGQRDAPKSDVRRAVLDVLPGLATMKPKNSDTFDAAALAIVAAREFTNQEVQENP